MSFPMTPFKFFLHIKIADGSFVESGFGLSTEEKGGEDFPLKEDRSDA